jgi:recombination protein RecT
VLAACAGEKPLWTSCPRAGLLGRKEARYMEHESPFGELALVCPDGQIVHALDWQAEQPVPLLKNVMRLTAPNPSVMTGPGTNTYIVGDASTGYIVIDPGPNDASTGNACGAPRVATSGRSCARTRTPTTRRAPSPCRRLCKDTPADPGAGLGTDVARRPAPSRRSRTGRTASVLSGMPAEGQAHTACASSTRRATPPTTCAWCWSKTACCSRATTS